METNQRESIKIGILSALKEQKNTYLYFAIVTLMIILSTEKYGIVEDIQNIRSHISNSTNPSNNN